jgi:hypothetical protein
LYMARVAAEILFGAQISVAKIGLSTPHFIFVVLSSVIANTSLSKSLGSNIYRILNTRPLAKFCCLPLPKPQYRRIFH